MENVEKKNFFEITELSSTEFLSFLYSERSREESLNSYQGWNVWAVSGAMVTIVCAIYSILCNHQEEINWLNTSYFASGIVGFFFCFRGWGKFFLSFLERKRGVDYRKIKYLKDVAPIPYLIVAFLCSITFVVFLSLATSTYQWERLSILWIFIAVTNVLTLVNLYFNNNSFVMPYANGALFPNVRLWIWIEIVISTTYSCILFQSFKLSTGQIFGSHDFEIAICLTFFMLLMYLMLKITLANKKSSVIDVLLDEYIYKGAKREIIFQKLQANRMGYGVFESCSQEFYALNNYYNVKRRELEDIKNRLDANVLDTDNILEQLMLIKKALDNIDGVSERIDALLYKLNTIEKTVPEIKTDNEFVNLQINAGKMINKARKVQNGFNVILEKFQKVIEKELHKDEYCETVELKRSLVMNSRGLINKKSVNRTKIKDKVTQFKSKKCMAG